MRSQFVWSRSTDLRTISRASSAASPVARLAAATTNAISRKLVGQIVDEIVHRDAVGQRRPLLVVAGIVGPFPGVAQVHVVADGHHHAALVVVYGAPAGLVPVLFIRLSGIEVLRAGYLKPFVQIVNRVEDRIAIGDLTIGRSGNTLRMLSTKTFHSLVPWKSSTIRKPPRKRNSRSWAA